MAEIVNIVSNVLIILFTVIMGCYSIYYVVTALQAFRKIPEIPKSDPQKKIAVIIPARNEERVIGNLVDSLTKQNYPKELYDIIVVPNNCTDDTAGAAARHGAEVMECSVPVKSKGEVLRFVFDYMLHESRVKYDAFCIFDSDNLVDPGFLQAMNDAFVDGARVTQGYRETKNPSDTWISACHSIYYYTINGFFNRARMAMGWSGALNGTGFAISRDYLEQYGFCTYTLTEDIEYTAQIASHPGERVTWVPKAVTYDEHPLTLSESWKQRRRWTGGTVQCFVRYFGRLFKLGINGGSACIDMLVLFMAPIMQILGNIPVIALICNAIVQGMSLDWWWQFLITSVGSGVIFYLFTIAFSWFVVKTEKRDPRLFIKGILTFGIFLVTWIPVVIIALVKPNCVWKPMNHTRDLCLEDVIGPAAEKENAAEVELV